MADKYTIQIVNEKGRIVKSETFSDIWEGEIREITLLPSEKKLFKETQEIGKNPLIKSVVDNILESRGLNIEFTIDYEKATAEDGILTISNKG